MSFDKNQILSGLTEVLKLANGTTPAVWNETLTCASTAVLISKIGSSFVGVVRCFDNGAQVFLPVSISRRHEVSIRQIVEYRTKDTKLVLDPTDLALKGLGLIVVETNNGLTLATTEVSTEIQVHNGFEMKYFPGSAATGGIVYSTGGDVQRFNARESRQAEIIAYLGNSTKPSWRIPNPLGSELTSFEGLKASSLKALAEEMLVQKLSRAVGFYNSQPREITQGRLRLYAKTFEPLLAQRGEQPLNLDELYGIIPSQSYHEAPLPMEDEGPISFTF